MNHHVMMRILSWQMTPRHTHFSVNIPLGAGHGLGLARISGMRLLSPFLPIPWISWVPPGGFSPALEEGARQGAGAVSSIPGGGLCLQLRVWQLPRGAIAGSLAGGTAHAAQRSRRDRFHAVFSLPRFPRVLQIPRAKNTAGKRRKPGWDKVVPQINHLGLRSGPTWAIRRAERGAENPRLDQSA